MHLIHFYVPETHAETVKSAMFKAGAGKIGNYSCCAWQTKGEGQFMPLEGSNAYMGNIKQLEKATECKVEMVCEEEYLEKAVQALKTAHPFETPAYHVIKPEQS